MFADAVVYAFVMTAKDYYVLAQRQFIGHWLVKLFAVGCGEDNLVVVALGGEGADTPVDRLALHHHACEAAEGVIVNAPVFANGVIAQVVQMNLHEPFFLGPAENALLKEALNKLGNNAYDIYAHVSLKFKV